MGAVVSCVSATGASRGRRLSHICLLTLVALPDQVRLPGNRRLHNGRGQWHWFDPQGHRQRHCRRVRHHHWLPHVQPLWRPETQDDKRGLVPKVTQSLAWGRGNNSWA